MLYKYGTNLAHIELALPFSECWQWMATNFSDWLQPAGGNDFQGRLFGTTCGQWFSLIERTGHFLHNIPTWVFWQLQKDHNVKEETIFTWHNELKRTFLILPGLSNARSSFQEAIDIILSIFEWLSVQMYSDHIIIFSRFVVKQFDNLQTVMGILAKGWCVAETRQRPAFVYCLYCLMY